MRGRHHTQEAIEKNRRAHLGQTAWNKGKPWSEGTREKLRRVYAHRIEETIKRCQAWARENGGVCEAVWQETRNGCRQTRARFRCSCGYVWAAGASGTVTGKTWCTRCRRRECTQRRGQIIATIDNVRKLCEPLGYELHTTTAIHSEADAFRLKCTHCGRIWGSTFRQLKDGHGCPYCRPYGDMENRCRVIFETLFKGPFEKCRPFKQHDSYLELDGYNSDLKIAFEYDGPQHREGGYTFRTTKKQRTIKERDNEKEQRCRDANIRLFRIGDLEAKRETLVDIIMGKLRSAGTRFVEPDYETLIRLRTPTDPLYRRAYGKNYLQRLREVCAGRGGRLLSEVWAGCAQRYDIVCGKGHLFSAVYNNVGRLKSWCPVCGLDVQRKKATARGVGLERCQRVAVERGGECRATEYINSHTPMQWYCNKHDWKWQTTACAVVIEGHWCPKCAKERIGHYPHMPWSEKPTRFSGGSCHISDP